VHASDAPHVRLYGLVYPTRLPSPEPISLAQLDPRTLTPVGRPTSLGHFFGLAIPSPDARRVAVASPRSSVLGLYEGVTPIRRVVLGSGKGQVRLIVWTSPDRLVAIVQRMSAPYARYVRARYAVGVDAANGRVLFRTRFDRRLSLTGWGTSGGRVALLYQSSSLLARRARLTIIDPDGRTRSAALRFGSGPTLRVFAGLAVGPASPRAYVVLSGGRVAVVDLRTLRARYHTIRALPAAASQEPFVLFHAATLGRHAVVLSGLFVRSASGREQPVGISVLDTRTWRARSIDRRASTFAVDGNAVVTAGRGVTGYAADGARLYHLLDAAPVSRIQIVQGRAHAWFGGTRRLGSPTRVMIFGPRSGTIFGRVTMSGRIRVAVLDSNGY
jgi:hypothetical protein